MNNKIIKIKNNLMTLPDGIVNEIKGANKFAYLMFVPGSYSARLRRAGITKSASMSVVDKSNVYCILVNKSQLIKFMQDNLNSLCDTSVRDALLNNIAISSSNSFKIPDAFSSYFSVGDFVLSGNEIWEKDAIEKLKSFKNVKKKENVVS